MKSGYGLSNASRQESVARVTALAATETVPETLSLMAHFLAEIGISVISMRLARLGFVTYWHSPSSSQPEVSTDKDSKRLLRAAVEGSTLEARCDSDIVDAANERAAHALLRAALIQIERCSRRSWEFIPPESESQSALRLASDIERVARLPYGILITGETGTGKTRAARVIHRRSPRREKPFVELNCAALPEQLVEAELFGCRRGAFTGADRDRKGMFEEADGGILFLDEIGDLPLSVQNKLLKAIDEKQIKRLGTNHYVSCDVQIIAATSRDLVRMIREGSFREDLYCRLAMLQVTVAPLRERREEIPALIDAFLREASQTVSRSAGRAINYRIEAGAVEALCAHEWIGNVRVLRNAICELTSYVADDELITMERVLRSIRKSNHRPQTLTAPPSSADNAASDGSGGDVNRISLEMTGSQHQILIENKVVALLQSFAQDGDIVLPIEVCLLRRGETLKQWTTRVKRSSIEAVRHSSGGTLDKTATRLGLTRSSYKGQVRRIRSK